MSMVGGSIANGARSQNKHAANRFFVHGGSRLSDLGLTRAYGSTNEVVAHHEVEAVGVALQVVARLLATVEIFETHPE